MIAWPGRAVIAAAALAATMTAVPGTSAVAKADPNETFTFQTPSGNMACYLGPAERDGTNGEVGEHTYSAPPPSPTCHLAWGDRFVLAQGSQPVLSCHGDTLRSAGLQRLDYSETAFSGAIRCSIESAGVTCTDTTTGHFFQLSRESYELG